MQSKKLTLIITGESGSGKSTLANFYQKKVFSQVPGSVVDESYIKRIKYDGEDYTLEIIDTVDNEFVSDEKRLILYQTSDCVILTYSIDDIQSFNNALNIYHKFSIMVEDHEKWTIVGDTIKKFPSIILVGCKSDLEMSRQVSRESALKVSEELAIDCCLECSTSRNIGVDLLFKEAIDLGYKYQNSDKEYKYVEEPNQLGKQLTGQYRHLQDGFSTKSVKETTSKSFQPSALQKIVSIRNIQKSNEDQTRQPVSEVESHNCCTIM